MHNPLKLFSCLVVIIAVLFLSACSAATASPTPTETSAPSDTPIPTDTLEPTDVPAPTETTALTVTAGVAQTMLAPLTVTPSGFIQAPSAADKAVFVGQNYPDGYRFRPGTFVSIVWTVKNDGTTAWATGYTLNYFAGTKGIKTSYAFPQAVPPGSSVQLIVSFNVPTTLGEYSTWWKLANSLGQNFSDVDFRFESSTTVGPPAATPTP